LPLRSDEKAALEIKLAGSFRIGSSERGAIVSTAPGREIMGGALGLIIDARGRPIHFAGDASSRQEQVASWYNVYRAALQQAEQEGSDDFATTSGPSVPTRPSTGLISKGTALVRSASLARKKTEDDEPEKAPVAKKPARPAREPRLKTPTKEKEPKLPTKVPENTEKKNRSLGLGRKK
jgi:hypothetical protein